MYRVAPPKKNPGYSVVLATGKLLWNFSICVIFAKLRLSLYLYLYEDLGPGREDLSGQWSVWCSHLKLCGGFIKKSTIVIKISAIMLSTLSSCSIIYS